MQTYDTLNTMNENSANNLNNRISQSLTAYQPMKLTIPLTNEKSAERHNTIVSRKIQIAPAILISASNKYIPIHHPWRLEQRSNALSQPLRRIVSRHIHPSGSIYFRLGLVASFSGTSYNDIIEVSVEHINQYVDLAELETFEHAQFEEEEEFKRRERIQLQNEDVKKGRGRPKKFREGAASASANDLSDSQEKSPGTESETSSSAASHNQAPNLFVKSNLHKTNFKLEIPLSPAYRDSKRKIPRSVFDNSKIKIQSRALKALVQKSTKRPKGRPKAKPVFQNLRAIPRSIHDRGKKVHSSQIKAKQTSKIRRTSRVTFDSDSELASTPKVVIDQSSDLDERVSLLQQFQKPVRPEPLQSHHSSRKLPRQRTPSSFPSTTDLPILNVVPRPILFPKSTGRRVSTNNDDEDRHIRKDTSDSDTEEDPLHAAKFIAKSDPGLLDNQKTKTRQGISCDKIVDDTEKTLYDEVTNDELRTEGGRAKVETVEPQVYKLIEENDETQSEISIGSTEFDKTESDVVIGAEEGDQTESDNGIENAPPIESDPEVEVEAHSDILSETAEDLLARFQTTARTWSPQAPRRVTHLQNSPHRSHPHNPPHAPTSNPNIAAPPRPLPKTNLSQTTPKQPSMTSPFPPGTASGFSTTPHQVTTTPLRQTSPNTTEHTAKKRKRQSSSMSANKSGRSNKKLDENWDDDYKPHRKMR